MATKSEIIAQLDAAGVEYPSGAKKAELETLLETAGDPRPPRCKVCGRPRRDGHIHTVKGV